MSQIGLNANTEYLASRVSPNTKYSADQRACKVTLYKYLKTLENRRSYFNLVVYYNFNYFFLPEEEKKKT